MILRRFNQLNDMAVCCSSRAKFRRGTLVFKRGREDMGATRSKRSRNFAERRRRIKEVLENVLGNVEVDAFVGETQFLEVFASHAIYALSRGDVRIILTWKVSGRFGNESSTGAST